MMEARILEGYGFSLLCSVVFKARNAGALPGAECLMDGILEDAGMVFHGEAIVHEDPERELDDSWLEEELLGFGASEMEALSEQQALLGSLLEIPDPDSEGSNSQSRRDLADFSVE
ncbi:Znfx1, partial [Symbiodinium pilosum]